MRRWRVGGARTGVGNYIAVQCHVLFKSVWWWRGGDQSGSMCNANFVLLYRWYSGWFWIQNKQLFILSVWIYAQGANIQTWFLWALHMVFMREESTEWTSVGGGREQKITATCNTNTCVCSKRTQYRCSAGYWGTGIIDISTGVGCTACASPGTSSAGTTSISGCCIPSGTTGTDSTGSYRYSSSCCWS